MKVGLYTVCNNSYVNKLHMMIESFNKYNPSTDFHILSVDTELSFYKEYKNIVLHDISYIYMNYLKEYTRPSYACKKIKSLLNTFIDIFNYDIIVYTDCDVLFYKDISALFKNKDFKNIHFSHDGGRERGGRKPIDQICTGFFMFSPIHFPNLLSDWATSIDKWILTKPKYLDQPAMRHTISSENYIHKFQIIPVTQISMKFKREDAIATHYIRKYGHNMYKDYHAFIQEQR